MSLHFPPHKAGSYKLKQQKSEKTEAMKAEDSSVDFIDRLVTFAFPQHGLHVVVSHSIFRGYIILSLVTLVNRTSVVIWNIIPASFSFI